ncbi:MAG: three-Cys-motif partner protein TcmP [Opitutaceae bacterium]|nr:three-Cys-motif partner protein TcmP [Opitutaceae bacterium]
MSDLDEIGDWSIDKLAILRAYAEQYSRILKNQPFLSCGYIDAFAGAGEHKRKATGEIVPGSPVNALHVSHAFDEYHFIDVDPDRVARLREITHENPRVSVHHGDCNRILLDTVFPRFRYEQRRRALCFLDPYGTHLHWEIMATAGLMKSVEIFLNFPVNDMNRNAKRWSLTEVSQKERERMTAFWGDESWHKAMFPPDPQSNFLGPLLGQEAVVEREKAANDSFAKAFGRRLRGAGGFTYVPDPVPMRNSRNSELYYLFFASNNATGAKIANAIFSHYRRS